MMASNNSSLPDWIPCGYNWTGPVLGDAGFGEGAGQTVGYIATLIACVFFGSNFVPFKFVKTGDGFFTQWVMCTGLWLVGLVVQLMRGQPVFYPMTLIGGAVWTIGNCCTVPIINLIGLSIGMLIWNCSNVLLGWATGRFGLFGLCPEVPNNEALNYAGVVLCVLAGGVYALVKTETKVTLPECLRKRLHDSKREDTLPSYPDDAFNTNAGSTVAVGVSSRSMSGDDLIPPEDHDGLASGGGGSEPVFLPNLSPMSRRILAIALALASGCCYGVQFLPSIYITDHVTYNGARASQNGLDYVFSQFCGIFLTSTIIFAGYMIINRKNALVSASIILPGLFSGVIWGIATVCFFLANSTLSAAVTFPIIATVPGMIATLWGIFLFREIRGVRNFAILGVAFSLTIAGAVLTALSKIL